MPTKKPSTPTKIPSRQTKRLSMMNKTLITPRKKQVCQQNIKYNNKITKYANQNIKYANQNFTMFCCEAIFVVNLRTFLAYFLQAKTCGDVPKRTNIRYGYIKVVGNSFWNIFLNFSEVVWAPPQWRFCLNFSEVVCVSSQWRFFLNFSQVVWARVSDVFLWILLMSLFWILVIGENGCNIVVFYVDVCIKKYMYG